MIDIFKLNRTQKRFYICGERLHVKVAFFIIIVMTLAAEILEATSYVTGKTPSASNFTTFAIEIWEYVVTVTMIIAFVKESTLFLLPYIGEMFVVVIMMLIFVFQLLFCLIAPYSSMAEQFFVDARYSLLQREKKLFAFFLFVGFFTLIAGYCLHIGLTTYMYFEYVNEKKAQKQRPARGEQASVLVRPDALPPPTVVVDQQKESFPNPNFGISDDEDDDVFHKDIASNASVA
ncbi:unnamed protein product [Nippostrongylus brasiliensis]|uniref:Uncharacterized protein n=1 Tax=Nippostrongylus brasiliensis TaxID=27835 RepID=A0A0N4XUH5_NIPBR|nr:hypothetical protein Q1695_001078 [Nippostrongylus brasiliensis]VDL69953.1 unnamed protein product [Nippostrongylus brasiliensis]